MPKVGKKHFAYSHAGRRAAKEYAKKHGLKVEYTESTYENISKLMFEVTKKEAEQTAREIKARHLHHGEEGATRQALQYLMNVKIEDSPETDRSKIPGAKTALNRVERRSRARAKKRDRAKKKLNK